MGKPGKPSTGRLRASIFRWYEIGALTFAGVLAASLLHPLLTTGAKAAISYTDSWTFVGVLLASIALTSLLALALAEMRGLHPGNLVHLVSYPPAWIAGLAGAWIVSQFAPLFFRGSLVGPFVPVIWLWSGLVLVLSMGIASSALKPSRYRRRQTPGVFRTPDFEQGPDQLWMSPEHLVGWLEREHPIDSPSDDMFRLASIATRLARRLTENPRGTLAAVGPYGAGKSSLISLLVGSLDRKQWITCFVRGWGIDADNTAEQLLERVLDTLSTYVDCLSLKALPARYRAALNGTESVISKVLFPLMQTEEPVEALKRLDAVLTPMGKNLLIIIEDLDRNELTPEMINDLASLLDRLRGLKRISFVLAIGRDFVGSLDLSKLCDFIEWIPPLSPGLVGRILRVFHDHCMKQFPGDVQVAENAESNLHRPSLRDMFDLNGEHEETNLVQALSKVLNTPRLLKHCLRRTWNAWHPLHGEVSFTDLLVVNALRAAAPEAFEFLVLSYEEIHAITDSIAARIGTDPKRADKLRKRLRRRLKRVHTSAKWDLVGVSYLLEYLVPALKNNLDADGSRAAANQRAWNNTYWQRIISELEPIDPDQPFLRRLKTWVDDRGGEKQFVSRLVENQIDAAKLERFERMLPAGRVLELASLVFDAALRSGTASANRDEVPGFLSLWRIALHKHIPARSNTVARFVLEQIQRAMPLSVRFAMDIEYFWASSESARMLGPVDALRVRRGVVAIAKRTFKRPADLVQALDPAFPYGLHHLIRRHHIHLPRTYDRWGWLAPTILAAATLNPTVVVPHLAILVSRSEQRERSRPHGEVVVHAIDDAFVSEFFTDKSQRKDLFSLLRRDVDSSALQQRDREILNAIREEAKTRLSGKYLPATTE